MVFKTTINGKEEPKKNQKSYHVNKKIAKEMRAKNITLNNYPIEDVRFQEKKEEQELIFYEVANPQHENT